MDDTQASRVLDVAATRKRRSSILKSQRPPRTPFSELEFNVATPTDTSKSRRVSFSRRTGVAEFVTNEATTTWKNFYEEHNKSAESSGNESGHARPPGGRGGQRNFDQQFEQVEAVDFTGSVKPLSMSSSLNNFEQQLASLECTEEVKLTAPHNKFELSAFTNQSKVFSDDLAVSCIGEVTDRIDVNFSSVRQIGATDDLDEIQMDLQKHNFRQPYPDRRDVSEYIEVDLNTTNIALKNYDDMSITDTIQSPKVQEISKNSSFKKNDVDWAVDKENIAINPYVAPREADNFAINEEPEKVLVFDGKRLTIQSEIQKDNCRQHMPEVKAQRKTIVLNVNDDLPNFSIDEQSKNASSCNGVAELKKNMILNDMTITQPLSDEDKLTIYDKLNITQSSVPENSKRRTIHYEDNSGDISVTQAIPTNIIDKAEKRRTIVYDNNNGDLSITQVVPSNVQEKRETIVFDSNISVTQAVPTNIMPNEKRRTIMYEDNAGNLSITQAAPTILIKEANAEKRRTIVYEDDTGNISITQAIPSNIITADNPVYDGRRRTVVFESDTGNISVTQAVPSNLILQENVNRMDVKPSQIIQEYNKRRTIVYEDDTGNLSITQAVPSNVLPGILNQIDDLTNNKRSTNVFEKDCADNSVTQAVANNQVMKVVKNQSKDLNDQFNNIDFHTDPPNKRRTVVFDNEDADISLTQVISSNQIISAIKHEQSEIFKNEFKNIYLNADNTAKRRTVVFDNEDADISVTQAVSVNQILGAMNNEQQVNHTKELTLSTNALTKRRTIVFDDADADITVTQAVSVNQVIEAMNNVEKHSVRDRADPIVKRQTVVFDDKDANISVTQAVPKSQIINFNRTADEAKTNKRRTVVFEKDEADISMTQAVNINKIIPGFGRNVHDDLEDALNEALHTRRDKTQRSIVFDDDNANISIRQDLREITPEDKRKTIVFEDNNISMPAHIIAELIDIKLKIVNNIKNDLKTSETHDVSMTDTGFEVSQKQDITSFNDEHLKVNPNEFKIKYLNIDQNMGNLSVTKPIPLNLANVKVDHHEKSLIKDADQVIEAKVFSDVIVFQAATTLGTQKLPKRTEQGDSRSQEPIVIANDEKLYSPDDMDVKSDNSENTRDQDSQKDKQCDVTQPSKSDTLNPQTSTISQKSKSIVDDLLDMSCASMEDVDKSLMVQEDTTKDDPIALSEPTNNDLVITDNDLLVEVDAQLSPKGSKPSTEANSDDVLFYITKDDEEDGRAIENIDMPQLKHSHLALEYKEPELASDLHDKLDELTHALNESAQNRYYEKILSTDLDKSKINTKTLENNKEMKEVTELDKSKYKKSSKSFRQANDTNDLLEMLTDLTDKSKRLDALVEESEPIKGPSSFTKNESAPEPRRGSLVLRRKSIVLSTEDLLKNISMAGETLQPQLDFDSELDDTNNEDSPKKPSRPSREIVKTLHFDDSITENSIETKMTPLKKTAFGETSYMQDSKAKVIPSYLKDVSDGVKELMDDLVKPMADVSFEVGVKKAPSTCSTQIQANIITSSQIDIVDSYVNVNKVSSVDIINDAVNRSMSRALKCPITHASEMSFENYESKTDVRTVISKPVENSRVLIFDHNNPLNNVLLSPDAYNEVHKYNPGSEQTICVSERSESVQISQKNSKMEPKDCEIEMSTQYVAIVHQSGDACGIVESQVSNLSKPMSIDQSTDVKFDVKDTEVNTDIAMKGNKELLEVSSSLTLVDDALTRGGLDMEIQSTTTSQEAKSMEPIEVIYTAGHDEKPDSLSNDDDDRKSMKRTLPRKQKPTSNQDVTPKPKSKVQKLSTTPQSEKANSENLDDKSRSKKPGSSLTVQHLMAEFNVGPIDHQSLDERIKGAILDPKSVASAESQDFDSISFTSSNNLRGDASATQSTKSVDYQGDSDDRSECEASVNVVAKLDMLPFMGSQECEWESSSGDSWSFLLLHGRLRLGVRLAHRVANALRTRVRADTPVAALTLDTVHSDEKNNIARLCVQFCAETMRYYIGRGCATAGEVPALLRHCAAAARRAAAWGRLMCEARLRLAAACDEDGTVSLKVANIPLRSVWEVTLRLELVVGDARDSPWVRAGHVRVRSVLAARGRAAPRVHRALVDLPRDWSHAPRAIWYVHSGRSRWRGEGGPRPRAERAGGARAGRAARAPRAGGPAARLEPRAARHMVRTLGPEPVEGGVRAAPRVHRALADLPRDWSHAPRAIWRIFKYLKNKTVDDEELFVGLIKA